MAKQTRKVEENSEKMDTVDKTVPTSKYQDEQQIAPSTGFKVETGKTNFVPEKKKAPGSTLKQEVAASVIKDASYGGSNSGDGVAFNGAKSSGSSGGVLGAANATPVAGQARSDSRISKKLDRNSTKLNFIPNDQVLVEWDESKPLADTAAIDQGFNGTYRNEFARSQKNNEAVPGALMFDRSVDIIAKDNIYFGQGQKVQQEHVADDLDILYTAQPDANGIYQYTDRPNYQGGITGNYLNTDVTLYMDINGKPIYTVYNDIDLECQVDQFDANKSSVQDHILMNDAELTRETMDTKAGDEKADIWTPLARAVKSPTQLVGFLRDLEANSGNEIFTAYRKFSSSMSFQLNRAHKDGQNTTTPMIHALTGLNHNYVSDDALITAQGNSINDLFDPERYAEGDSQLMIALYDSIAKYNNKADFLVQPRGFRMHLQTADNNLDPFRVSKLFANVYDQQETFSTIDRDFDPMSPVCITDKAAVVHRLSWHKMGSYIHNHVLFNISDIGSASDYLKLFTLVPGNMVTELKKYEYNIYITYPKDLNGDIEFSNGAIAPSRNYSQEGVMIMDIQTTAPTVPEDYELLTIDLSTVNDGQPIIFYGNVNDNHLYNINYGVVGENSEKIYAYQGGPLNYKYADLRNNYVVTVRDFLTAGLDKYITDSIGTKLFDVLSLRNGRDKYELPITIQTVHSTMFFSLWSILLCAATPWIIKERINSFRDVLYYEKNVEYPFSSTLIPLSEVSSKSYSNFSYINYDTELSSGLMKPSTAITWMLPEMYQQVGYISSSQETEVLCPWYTNQNAIRYINGSYQWDDDASSMSFPSIRSGVRLAALDNLYGMTEKDVRLCLDMISSFKNLHPTLVNSRAYKYSTVCDGQLILAIDKAAVTPEAIMSLPRELGFFMTAPYGTLTTDYNGGRYSASPIGTTSFRTYYWFGDNIVTTTTGNQEILHPVAVNVNRAQNFTQKWYCVLASGTIPSIDHGFLLSATSAFSGVGALLLGRSQFTPYTTLIDNASGPSTLNMNKMRSLQKVYWTRIQKLPFVISPFDLIQIDNNSSPNDVVINDIFDLCYFFGLGGFRASDYRESVYNREKEYVNQGMLFTSDPWIESSPVFRDGSTTSGIKNTKGFEL